MPEQTTPADREQDAARRREWAAATRDVADAVALHAHHHGVASPSQLAALIHQRANRIEVGTLTPWADGAEPAATPAESHQEPPADPDPHPDTPDQIRGNAVVIGTRMAPGYDPPSTSLYPHPDEATPPSDPHPDSGDTPGVLGRALLDRDGDVWPEKRGGGYGAFRQSVEWVNGAYGPVREVLLVDPAAARVIEAAVRARTAERYADQPGGWGQWQDAVETLTAAVDALTGGQDTPTDTDTDNPPTETASPQATAGGQADTTAVGCVLTTDRDMQAFVELPDCPACDGCGKQVPEDWYRDYPPEPAVVRLAPGVHWLGEVAAEDSHSLTDHARLPTGPEPAGDGPGWDREHIDMIAGGMEMDGAITDAAAIRSLLAERDRQAGRVETLESIRDADTEELERQRSLAGQARAQRDAARRELEQAREALGSYAMGEGDMPVRDQQIRRDGAADALGYGAGWIRRVFVDGNGPEAAKCLDALAYGFRTGQRDVPGGERG